MKILKTKSGKFSRFIKKNGGFLVLALVLFSVSVAVFASTDKIKSTLFQNSSSELNLSGDDENCDTSSQNISSAQKTDTKTQSSQQSSQQGQSSQLYEQSSSQGDSEQITSSQNSQPLLFLLPVSGKVINEFSGSKPVKSKTMGDWRLHTGVDLAAEKGTSVRASAEGEVSKIYNDDLWGTTIEIEHIDGTTTIYSNLNTKVYVEKGQKVESGQSIGKVDTSAKIELAENPHLHFAAKRNGKYIDPMTIVTKPIGD